MAPRLPMPWPRSRSPLLRNDARLARGRPALSTQTGPEPVDRRVPIPVQPPLPSIGQGRPFGLRWPLRSAVVLLILMLGLVAPPAHTAPPPSPPPSPTAAEIGTGTAVASQRSAGEDTALGTQSTAVRNRRPMSTAELNRLPASLSPGPRPLQSREETQAGRWAWPVPSPHPVLRHFDRPSHAYGPGHRGIDIGTAADAPVRAVEGGTVRFTGSVAGRGVVSVTHADGLISTYEPVRATVREGQRVQAGDVLGTVSADVGGGHHCGTMPCLHLGARYGQADYVDPELLLGAHGPSVLLPWAGAVQGA